MVREIGMSVSKKIFCLYVQGAIRNGKERREYKVCEVYERNGSCERANGRRCKRLEAKSMRKNALRKKGREKEFLWGEGVKEGGSCA
jgi:hypothetical protein